MDTNVEKNNQTASQLQPAVGGELDPQVVVRENRTTTCRKFRHMGASGQLKQD